jgi:hypothetical protein
LLWTMVSCTLWPWGGEDEVPLIQVEPAPATEPVDLDGDGFTNLDDCDDADPVTYPGAVELCDGRQNDCSGQWNDDKGLATWFTPQGSPTDVTADIRAGTLWEPEHMAIDSSGMLTLCSGKWYATLSIGGEDVTIRGIGPDVALVGDRIGALITVETGASTFVLEDVTVRDGWSADGGGLTVAATEPVDVTLRRTTFLDNAADRDGGAVYVRGDLTLEDAAFENNEASNGGAVFVEEGTLTAVGGVLRHNGASGGGGGAYVLGDVSLEGTTFEDNEASDGGALDVTGGTLLTTGAVFRGNTAGAGGAVEADSTTLALSDTRFESNGAMFGGHLDLWRCEGGGERVTIEQTAFDAADGGGVRAFGSTLTLTDSVLRGNTANQVGGALSLDESTVVLEDTVVDDNLAADDVSAPSALLGFGGGAYLQDSVLVCRGTGGFSGNRAVHGPAVYADFEEDAGSLVSEGCDWTSAEASLSQDVDTSEVEVQGADGLTFGLSGIDADETFTCDPSGCG